MHQAWPKPFLLHTNWSVLLVRAAGGWLNLIADSLHLCGCWLAKAAEHEAQALALAVLRVLL